jgi:hypothetical protein
MANGPRGDSLDDLIIVKEMRLGSLLYDSYELSPFFQKKVGGTSCAIIKYRGCRLS